MHARAMNGKHLIGGHFCLDYPSVGATETLMMAAALADGKSTLSNVAQVHKLLTKQYISVIVSMAASMSGKCQYMSVVSGARGQGPCRFSDFMWSNHPWSWDQHTQHNWKEEAAWY